MDQFDFSFNPSIKRQQIYELATCRFIREAKDVLWLGPPGVGKSFLVQALGYQAIKSGFLVYYRSIFDVVRDFMQDEAFAGQDKVLAKYLKPDLLIDRRHGNEAASQPRAASSCSRSSCGATNSRAR